MNRLIVFAALLLSACSSLPPVPATVLPNLVPSVAALPSPVQQPEPAAMPIPIYSLTRTPAADRTPGCALVAALDMGTQPARLRLSLERGCSDEETIGVRLTDPRAVSPANPEGDLYGVGWHGGSGSGSFPLPLRPGSYRVLEVGGSTLLIITVR